MPSGLEWHLHSPNRHLRDIYRSCRFSVYCSPGHVFPYSNIIILLFQQWRCHASYSLPPWQSQWLPWWQRMTAMVGLHNLFVKTNIFNEKDLTNRAFMMMPCQLFVATTWESQWLPWWQRMTAMTDLHHGGWSLQQISVCYSILNYPYIIL